MKARLYCGTVVWSPERKSPVGVLMFEASLDHYTTPVLRDRIRKEGQGFLGTLIDARD
jgi:hypothetical protein